MTLKAHSWLATGLVTVGILGFVASLSMDVLRPVLWPSAASVVAGIVAFILVVRRASDQMRQTSQRIESMLSEAALSHPKKPDQGNKTA